MSNNPNNAVQPEGANQAEFVPNAVQGLPSVSFDGASQFMQLGPGFGAWSQGASIFLVTKPRTVEPDARFFDLATGAASNNLALLQPNDTDFTISSYMGATPGAVTAEDCIELGKFQLLQAIQSSNSATLFVNGQQKAQGSLSIASTTKTGNFIGRDFGDSVFFDGEIAELLIYNRAVNASERQGVENYLFSRYALQVTPPVVTPGYGVFASSQSVSISAGTGSTIYYTLDGSTPTTKSTQYTGSFQVSESTTIKAIAVNSFGPSSVTTAHIQIDPTTAAVTRSGLVSWLKADQGVVTSGSAVTEWRDMSTVANNAQQVNSSNRPQLVADAVNGLPAIGFNGTSQYLQFAPGFATFAPGASIFIVTKPLAGSADQRILEFGNGATNNNIFISRPDDEDIAFHAFNGSSGSSVSAPSTIELDEYQVLEVVHNGAGFVTISNNGVVIAQGPVNNLVNQIRDGNFVGRDYANTLFFKVEIAEIMVYNRPLTRVERFGVRGYLFSRYALGINEPIIAPAYGVFGGNQNVSIASDPRAQVFYTTDGSEPTTSSTEYTGLFNISSSTTVKALAVQPFETSAVSSAYLQIDTSTANVTRNGLVTWLKSDNGVTVDSDKVSRWQDMSAVGNDAVQASSSSQPDFAENAVLSLAALGFDGAGQFMQFGPGFANFTQGCIAFVMVKPIDVAAGARLLDFGNGSLDDSFFLSQPASADVSLSVYAGTSPSSLTAQDIVTLDEFQMLEFVHNGQSATGTIFKNSQEKAAGPVNPIVNILRNENLLGRDGADSVFFEGQIAEVMIYNRALSTAERRAVEGYLTSRYQLPPNPPTISPDHGVFSGWTQISMIADPGADIFYTLDGSQPTITSTQYTGAFSINESATIKAIAVQPWATSDTASVFIQIDPHSSMVQRAGLITWLKADNGVVTGGSSVARWKDMSGGRRDAVQNNSSHQPELVSDAANGLPVVRFDGGGQFLQLPAAGDTFLTGATILVVAKPTAVAANARLLQLATGSSNNDSICLSQPNDDDVSFFVYSGSTPTSVTANGSITLNAYQVITAVQSGSSTGSIATTRVSGKSENQGAIVNIPSVTRSNNRIASDHSGTVFFEGDIAEILIYNQALTPNALKNVESYLYSRYGIYISAPRITPTTAVIDRELSVSINADPGATTYYTLDGSEPTTSSTKYTGAFWVNIYIQ